MATTDFIRRLSTARLLTDPIGPYDADHDSMRMVIAGLLDRIDRALAVAEDEQGEYASGGSASDAVQDMTAILRGAVADERGFLVEPTED
jgi:hypothetical protein